jgi:hypothetical protein
MMKIKNVDVLAYQPFGLMLLILLSGIVRDRSLQSVSGPRASWAGEADAPLPP